MGGEGRRGGGRRGTADAVRPFLPERGTADAGRPFRVSGRQTHGGGGRTRVSTGLRAF